MNKLGCFFGKHDWLMRNYTGRGLVQGYRKCLDCPAEETLLHDFRKQGAFWIKGKYAQEEITDYQQIFIFAGSASSFTDSVETLKQELPDHKMVFVWVQYPATLTEMAKIKHPAMYFPSDWKENPVTDDYRFTLLFTVGHL